MENAIYLFIYLFIYFTDLCLTLSWSEEWG